MNKSDVTITRLSDNAVHLWHIYLPPFFSIDPENTWLTEDEKQRAKRYLFEKHQLNFATCRKLLKKILARYLNCSPTEINLQTDEFGKPFLPGDLRFNLSHSADYFFLGINLKNDIGVDIEQIKPRDFLGLAKHSFSEIEEQSVVLADEAERACVFYKIWCQKEAFIKFEGRGLRYPLKEFSVSSKARGGLIDCKAQHLKNTSIYCYQSAPELFAAVCTASSNVEIINFGNIEVQQYIL